MRNLSLLALGGVLLAGPVLAQGTPPGMRDQATTPLESGRPAPPPVDRGPSTPDANRAYGGGGVTLEGAPGAPAPTPTAPAGAARPDLPAVPSR